ncbi:MAG: ABC transporter permease subunit [Nocardioides sp.]
MLSNVFTKSLRDQRWALAGWSVGIAVLVIAEAAVWPTFDDMPDLDRLLESYPKALRELFDIDAMSTGTGFMNTELFTLMLPVLFIIFAVTRGARLIAGEEEDGTLEVVLVTPVTTWSLVLQKAAALAAALTVLGTVLTLAMVASSAAFDVGISLADTLSGTLAMMLLGMEFGALSLAIGTATGRRSWALGAAGAAAAAGYVLYGVGLVVDALEPWQPFSPFHQALKDGPLGAPPPATSGWVVLGAVAVLAVAIPTFDRRDIHAR